MSAIGLKSNFLKSKTNDQFILNGLSEIVQNSQEVAFNMRETMWSLSSDKDTLEHFVIYAKQYIASYFEQTNIATHFDIPIMIDNLPLSSYVRRQLFLCVKEISHNVIETQSSYYD